MKVLSLIKWGLSLQNISTYLLELMEVQIVLRYHPTKGWLAVRITKALKIGRA